MLPPESMEAKGLIYKPQSLNYFTICGCIRLSFTSLLSLLIGIALVSLALASTAVGVAMSNTESTSAVDKPMFSPPPPQQVIYAPPPPLSSVSTRSSMQAVVLSQEFHIENSTQFGNYSSLCAIYPEVVEENGGMSGCVTHLSKESLNEQDMEAAFLTRHSWVSAYGLTDAYETKLSKSGNVYTRTFTYTSWDAFKADAMTGSFAYNTTNWAVDSLIGEWAQYNLQSWYYEVEAEHCAELTTFIAQARANWVSLSTTHMPFFYATDTWDHSYVFCRIAGSDHDTRYFAAIA